MTPVYERYLQVMQARDWYFVWFGLIIPMLLATVIYALERYHRAKPVIIGILIGYLGGIIYAITQAF